VAYDTNVFGRGDKEVTQKLRLPRRAESAGAAREALDELATVVDGPLLYDIRLLVSEVVANRMRHPARVAAAWLEVEVDVDPKRVRIEVNDVGQHWVFEPAPFSFDPENSSGWSLYLVDRITDRWGLVRGDAAVSVWFEIDRD
jgi:anti-sigma regulatory factor (Ser/Thr protein kinase)